MTGTNGGPGDGGHKPDLPWYMSFGNDLSAAPGTPVRAICDGKITALDTTHVDPTTFDKEKGVYGAGVFIQATSAVLQAGAPGGVGMYYTHIDLAPGITNGAAVVRGQVLGHVIELPPKPSHLHFAICERRAGQNFGVNIYALLQRIANTATITTLTFLQDGRPPQEGGSPTPPPTTPTPPPTTPTPPPTTPTPPPTTPTPPPTTPTPPPTTPTPPPTTPTPPPTTPTPPPTTRLRRRRHRLRRRPRRLQRRPHQRPRHRLDDPVLHYGRRAAQIRSAGARMAFDRVGAGRCHGRPDSGAVHGRRAGFVSSSRR